MRTAANIVRSLRYIGIQKNYLAITLIMGGLAGVLSVAAVNTSAKWTPILIISAFIPMLVMLVKDLRKLILVIMVVDIPLGLDIAVPDYEWHQGGPNGFIISLITVALVAGYALWIAEQKPRINHFIRLSAPTLLYILMILISFFQSRRIDLSVFGLFLNLEFFLMFLYIANHLRQKEDFKLVMTALAVCLLFESIVMILQYFLGLEVNLGPIQTQEYAEGISEGAVGVRVGGTIGGPNGAATYLAACLPIMFGLALTDKFTNPLLILAATGLGTMALIFTASRSAWGSLVISLLVIIAISIKTRVFKKALLGFLLAGTLAFTFFRPQIEERLNSTKEDTTRPELEYMAYNIIEDFPVGVGKNNYDQVMSDRYAHPKWVGHTLMVVHNKFLIVWAETGVHGLIAFCLLLFCSAWEAVRCLQYRRRIPLEFYILNAAFLAALVGYVFHMQTEGLSTRASSQILWLIIALIAAVGQYIKNMSTDVSTPTPLSAGY